MKKQWSVKFSSKDGDRSTVRQPRRLKLVAWFEGRFPPMQQPVATIVNHDAEMRAWGRYDWVDYPTTEDTERLHAMRHRIIGSIAPGESVEFEIPPVVGPCPNPKEERSDEK